MFEVMITIVFLKSTVRPWPSVSRPSSRICKQHVEDVGVGFLDFVEEYDAVGAAAHRFGQLAAFVVADISGRRADKTRDRVLLLILRHVDANHRALVVEQVLGQRPRQFGFADAGRSQEDERCRSADWGLQARPRAEDRFGNRVDGFVLSDDALVQFVFEMQQLCAFAFEELRNRNAGPSC